MSGTDHTSAKPYLIVGTFLGVFTVATVVASYFHLPAAKAIPLALLIASIKGTLVGLYFMHLKGESRIVLGFLALTIVFLVVLMILPALDVVDHPAAEPGSIPPVVVEHHASAPEPAH